MRDKPKKPWNPGKATPVRIAGKKAPSLGAISRGTGIDRAHVSRIFAGLSRPSLTAATKLAAFFGISLDNLARYLAERDQTGQAA